MTRKKSNPTQTFTLETEIDRILTMSDEQAMSELRAKHPDADRLVADLQGMVLELSSRGASSSVPKRTQDRAQPRRAIRGGPRHTLQAPQGSRAPAPLRMRAASTGAEHDLLPSSSQDLAGLGEFVCAQGLATVSRDSTSVFVDLPRGAKASNIVLGSSQYPLTPTDWRSRWKIVGLTAGQASRFCAQHAENPDLFPVRWA